MQRMAPSNGQSINLGGLPIAALDAGVAVIKIFLGIPMLIGAFIYDMASLLLFFLPAQCPPALLTVIGMATLLPILAIILEIASSIKPPGLAKW